MYDVYAVFFCVRRCKLIIFTLQNSCLWNLRQ